MPNWIPIISYGPFHDVPRTFLIVYGKQLVMFDSRFNEATDDYETSYTVYLMPNLSREEIKSRAGNLAAIATSVLGQVPVNRSMFDDTLRKAVSEEFLAGLNLESTM